MIRQCLCILLLSGMSVASPMGDAAEIRTLAGNGQAKVSGEGGPGREAGVNDPFGLDIGPDGALYWAEYGGHVIRRMDLDRDTVSVYAGTPDVAGYVDGPALSAKFSLPHEIRFDADGNLYVADMRNHTIRRIDHQTQEVTTVAGTGKAGFSGDDGPATAALLDSPHSVVLDADRQFLICDIKNHRIRGVNFRTGIITTVAGTGKREPTPDMAPVVGTPLNGPRTLAIDSKGNVIIVLREGNAVYRWMRDTNTLQHLAGTGKSGYAGDGGDAKQALLSGPKGAVIGPDGDIYLADTESHTVRVIRMKTGILETLVGDGKKGDGPDGDPRKCRLNRPHGVFFDADGRLYIGDSSNHKVRVVSF